MKNLVLLLSVLAVAVVLVAMAVLTLPATGQGAPAAKVAPPAGVRKLLDTPLRDPSICRGPDGTYYLTGTSEPFWKYNNDNGASYQGKA